MPNQLTLSALLGPLAHEVSNQPRSSAQSGLPGHKASNSPKLLAQLRLLVLFQQSLARVPRALLVLVPPKGLIIQNTMQKTV